MAHSILLHIGPRKTGSTFLQRALTGVAPELAQAGLLYPTTLDGVARHNHVAATYAIPGMRAGRSPDRWAHVGRPVLADFVEQITAWQGPVLISSEALGGLPTTSIRDFLSYLPDVPITVIATIRALPDVVLSSWAQHVRNMHRESLQSYTERRISEREGLPRELRWQRWDSDPYQTFWRSYDYPSLLTRWSALGLTLRAVVVPGSHSPSSELWSRFRRAAALDVLPVQCPEVSETGANMSMRMEELEVIRHTTKHASRMGLNDSDLTPLRGHRWMPSPNARPTRGTRPGLPPDQAHRFAEWAREDVELMQSLGFDIVGNVSDLFEPGRPVDPADPELYAQAAGYLVADRILRVEAKRKRRPRSGRWRKAMRRVNRALRRRLSR